MNANHPIHVTTFPNNRGENFPEFEEFVVDYVGSKSAAHGRYFVGGWCQCQKCTDREFLHAVDPHTYDAPGPRVTLLEADGEPEFEHVSLDSLRVHHSTEWLDRLGLYPSWCTC